MRDRRSTAALIISVAALVAIAVLGVMYVEKRPLRESLALELAAAKESLSESISQSEEQAAEEARRLQEQLAALEAKRVTEEQAIAVAIDMLEEAYSLDKRSPGGILKSIFQLANESGVDIIVAALEPLGDETRGDLTFRTLSIDLKVSGGLTNIAVFVSHLEKGPVKSVTIDSINIGGEGNLLTADLTLSVLYPGL